MKLGTLEYRRHRQDVLWEGISFKQDNAFDGFLDEKVCSRLIDFEGTQEVEAHLRGLALTGFGKSCLQSVLSAGSPEERDWAIGEAMAEAWLTEEHQVIWPWNMERDKRNSKASLPGADLVGFVVDGSSVRLALGEVKSSSETKSPPQIMSGRSGHMGHQLDKLASDLGTIHTLFCWLLFRCKNTGFESFFNQSATLYFNSGNKAVSLFGVLIRGTCVDESDLRARGEALAQSITLPTTCRLIALYLPFGLAQLPEKLRGRSVL